MTRVPARAAGRGRTHGEAASAHAGHRLVGSLAVRLVKTARWPVMVCPDGCRRLGPSLLVSRRWGGWGSNPRPADYEKYGLMHRAR